MTTFSTLSTFIYEPIHWIDRYGWRPTCRTEKLGYYAFWREVGTRMGIHDLPPTYERFEQWARAYEGRTFRCSETSQTSGLRQASSLHRGTRARVLAPVVRAAVHALLDDAMLDAFGFPRPLPGARRLIGGMLRLRGRIVRRLPPRREPNFFTDRPNRTNKKGYEIDSLGPPRLVAAQRKQASDPPATMRELSGTQN